MFIWQNIYRKDSNNFLIVLTRALRRRLLESTHHDRNGCAIELHFQNNNQTKLYLYLYRVFGKPAFFYKSASWILLVSRTNAKHAGENLYHEINLQTFRCTMHKNYGNSYHFGTVMGRYISNVNFPKWVPGQKFDYSQCCQWMRCRKHFGRWTYAILYL